MVRAAKDIPWSWEVTSDSLAAWLAGRIGAQRVLLIKHVEPPAGRLRAAALVADEIIDPAFPRFLRASGAQAFIAGPSGACGGGARHAQPAAWSALAIDLR